MSLIDEVIQRLDIDIVKGFTAGNWKKKGHDWVGKCPTGHTSESEQSFQINSAAPTFKCWGCGISGNWIHLFELVKYGTSSQGQGFTENFKSALNDLAEMLSIETNEFKSNPETEKIFTVIDLIICQYQKQMTDEHYDFLFKKYGWTKEQIILERIGYSGSDPQNSLSEFFDKDDFLKSGLYYQYGQDPKPIYQHRYVFPYIIGGRVKYSIGRMTDKTPQIKDRTPSKYVKHLIHTDNHNYVSKCIKNEILRYQVNQDYIIISEGIADYYSLKFNGYNTISAVTTSFKNDDYGRIKEICSRVGTVYICNDNEENKAGLKGAERIAIHLLEIGINPLIILLPIPPDEKKMDVAEFFRTKSPDDFEQVKQKSQSFIDMKLFEIPTDIDKSILSNKLSDILNLISFLPEELIEVFIYEKIAKRFKLAGMKSYITALKNKVIGIRDARAGKKEPKSDDLFSENKGNIKLISAGQDYDDGNLYYTVTRPFVTMDKKGMEKIINKLFIIGSDRSIKEVRDGQIVDGHFALKNKLSPEYKSDRWAFMGSDYSIEKFITEKVTINPAEIFIELRDHFNKYIFFKIDGIADHLAIVVMASYLYMIFHSIGYIHFWAEKRSGKTTAMELLNELGFNSRMSSSISDAAIFRSIENHRPILLIDEAEHLNPSPKQREMGIQNERLELFKSGYKKAGMATRCEGQNNIVMDFSNYCIKVFASIKSLDSTLEDRTIIHEFKRASSDTIIEEWRPDKTKESFEVLRNKLHCFAMQFAHKVDEHYKNLDDFKPILEIRKIKFRNRELWGPYIAIATLIDDYNGELNVFNKILAIAEYSINNKEAFSKDSKSLIILEKFYQWVMIQYQGKMTTPMDGIFLRTTIIENFINNFIKQDEDEDLSFLTYPILKDILRKFDVIDASSEIAKVRLGTRQGKAIRIVNDKILEALITYKTDYAEDVLDDIEKYKMRKNNEYNG
jgi:hypothetical protein